MTEIFAQVEHMARVANFWCDFALICGSLGFILSVAAAILLIKIMKEENNGTVNSDAG